MPELIAFYEDYAQHRDKFEVFAIHDDAVKSFAELDKKLVTIKQQKWRGKDLPFPILLDGKKKTHALYGVHGWPTGVLIDPEGKVVDEASIGELESNLPPLPVTKRWARHRDITKNVFWSFEPKDNTLSQFAETLKRWSGCDVIIDVAAVKTCGLTTDGSLPGVVIGSPITLRSLDELLLGAHGLGVVPSAEGQVLRITGRPQTKEESPSYFQKLRAKQLNDLLDNGPDTQGDKPPKPIQIKDQPLLEAIKRIAKEYDLSVGLDAKAMRTGTINPDAKVNGAIDPNQLRKSLLKLLAPLGLTVEVRDEVAVITPTPK